MADPNDGSTDGTAEGNGVDYSTTVGNIPVPLPTPTPQAVPTSTVNTVKSGGFGISIPPDTRNQGGISLKASEFLVPSTSLDLLFWQLGRI